MAETRKGMAGWGEAWRFLALALGAFALIAAVLFATATLSDRDAALRTGRDNAEAAAELLAEQAERTVRIAQLSADQVESVVLRQGPLALRGEGSAVLRNLAMAAGEIGSIWVLDPHGRVIANSLQDPPPPIDLSGGDFIPALRGGAETFLSGMLRSPTTGTWIFAWSQAVRREGELVAIVHVALAAEPFAPLAQRLPLGSGAMLALKRPDGVVLLRWPLPETTPGLGRPRRDELAGVTEETGPDGDLRIVAWRTSATTGVVA